MRLPNLKNIAEKKLNAAVVDDCFLGIQVFFHGFSKKSCHGCNDNCWFASSPVDSRNSQDSFSLGIYEKDLPENDQLNVALVDVGHASMRVCIAGIKQKKLYPCL
uniref:Uncharacterized protein n=1 Tax=Nelumbo nucifera TaxID=4432 RepID=A0A822ZHH8_NELNU|nr:TPA_asm: hypothetical protein HUJ06_001115 [Nelumbo nucifera]